MGHPDGMAPPVHADRLNEGEGPTRLPLFVSPSDPQQRHFGTICRKVEALPAQPPYPCNCSRLGALAERGGRGDTRVFIRSERLFLRPGWPEEWAEIDALLDEETTARHLVHAPWPWRGEQARARATSPQDARHPWFFVTLPGTQGARLVGCVGLVAPGGPRSCCGEAELAVWIGWPFRGRGYAAEAVRALLPVSRTLGHRRLLGRVRRDNPAAARALASAGLQPVAHPATGADEQIHALDLDMAGNCNRAMHDGTALAALIRAA